MSRASVGREDGFSLAEILVVVALVALVSTLVTSAVIDSTKVSRVANAGLISQAQLLDAVSRVTRDVSISNAVISTRTDAGWPSNSPSATDVTVESRRDASCLRTRYWAVPADATLRSETEQFVGQPCPAGTGDRSGVITATMVKALDPSRPIFTYFDGANQALAVSTGGARPAGTVAGDDVARIGIDVAAAVVGRPNGVRLQTSAVPRSADPNAEAADFAPPGQTACEARSTGLTTGQVTWRGVAGARGYSVLRSDGAATSLAEGSSLIWAQAGLIPHEGYSFEVFPYNSDGFALTAAQCSFTAALELRGRVIIDGSDGVDNDNELTWDRQSTATGYVLYRDGVPLVTVDSGDIVRYVDRNRPWGATNVYVITALNDAGVEGPRSNQVTLRIRPPAPEFSHLFFVDNDNNPDNQNNGQLFCGNNFTNNNCAYNDLLWRPAAGWTAPPGTTYQVYRDGVPVDGPTSGLSAKNYQGQCGVRITYGLEVTVPFNGTSDRVEQIVDAYPCDPVLTGTAFIADADATLNDVRLSWAAQPVSPTFEVYRGGTLIASITSNLFIDRNRPAGTSTSYYVRAVNSAGRAASNTVSVLVVPAAPALTSLLAGDNALTWDWTGVTGASSYYVDAGWAGTASFPLRVMTASTSRTYTAATQVAQRPYDGYVEACNAAGCSKPSTIGRATPTSSYRAAVMASGPQAYWRLGDLAPGVNAVTRDETVNANSLTYATGTTGATTGFPLGLDAAVGALALDDNHAADLPDANDTVRGDFRRSVTGTGAANFTALANVTMEAWAYLDGTEHGMFVRAGDCATQSSASTGNPCSGYGIGVGGNRTSGGQTGYSANGAPFLSDGNRVMALVERCGWTYGPTDVPAPVPGWHHIVLTVSSLNVGTLYQDGAVVATFLKPSATCLQAAVGFFHVGGYQYTYDSQGNVISRYFAGKLDEVAYYARTLSATEVAQHFYLGRYCSTTVGSTVANCG